MFHRSSISPLLSPFVLLLLLHLTSGHLHHIRGPHHPKSQRDAVKSDEGTHSHYVPHKSEQHKLTQDQQLLHDEEHIREDLEGIVSETAAKNMTPEELEFHYFKIHDFDNNLKLDGLELLQAILHTSPFEDTKDADGSEIQEAEKRNDETFNYFVELIDEVLASDDKDRDGYLNYIEYVVAKNREDTRAAAEVHKMQL